MLGVDLTGLATVQIIRAVLRIWARSDTVLLVSPLEDQRASVPAIVLYLEIGLVTLQTTENQVMHLVRATHPTTAAATVTPPALATARPLVIRPITKEAILVADIHQITGNPATLPVQATHQIMDGVVTHPVPLLAPAMIMVADAIPVHLIPSIPRHPYQRRLIGRLQAGLHGIPIHRTLEAAVERSHRTLALLTQEASVEKMPLLPIVEARAETLVTTEA